MNDRSTMLMMERLRTIAARKERFSYDVRTDSYINSDIVVAYDLGTRIKPTDLQKVFNHAIANDSVVSGHRQPDGLVHYSSCRFFTDMGNAQRFAREQNQPYVFNWNREVEMVVEGEVIERKDTA